MEFLAPALSRLDQMGFFEFIKLAIKLGIQWAKENPLAIQIANDMVVNKTLEKEKLRKTITDEAFAQMDSDPHHLYIKPIENSIARGELTDTYSPEIISYYTQTLIGGVGELLLSKNPTDPFGEEGEKIYDDFLNILKYGLCKIEHKEKGDG